MEVVASTLEVGCSGRVVLLLVIPSDWLVVVVVAACWLDVSDSVVCPVVVETET